MESKEKSDIILEKMAKIKKFNYTLNVQLIWFLYLSVIDWPLRAPILKLDKIYTQATDLSGFKRL